MASGLDGISMTHIISELIKFIEGILELHTETAPHLILKPCSETGTVLFIPRDRKLLEEKLITLVAPQGEYPECQLFNFSEKFQRELVTFLNGKMQHKFIHHYDLLYNQKMCALTVNMETNQLIKSSFKELETETFHPDISIFCHVIVNLKCIEHLVLDPNITLVFSEFLLDKKVELGELDKAKTNPTIDIFRNSSIGLALKNLISMRATPGRLIDSFDWRESREEMKELLTAIYLACEKSGSMVKEEDTKIILEKRNEKLKNDAKNKENQKCIEVLIKRKDASYSREVLLAGLILYLTKTRKVTETDRIFFLFNQRMKDCLIRSLNLLHHLGFLNNDIYLITQFEAKQAKDLTAMMEARGEYLYQMLHGRCGGVESVNDDEMRAKANEICEMITKFELLSHPTNQEVKLVESVKLGTHHSMFVLYNYARIVQILKRFEYLSRNGTYPPLTEVAETDFNLLVLNTEWRLFVNYILKFPLLLNESLTNSNTVLPNCISNICKFLISLSQDFSAYYSKCKILTQPGEHLYPRIFARIHLLTALRRVMDLCFQVLDIQPFEQI